MLYRLLRAIAAIGLLAEDDSKGFRLTEAGALLREDHPHSLKAMALLEEGPEHYAAWKHLVPIGAAVAIYASVCASIRYGEAPCLTDLGDGNLR